ncbi:MAG: UbiA family prenyltransferase [Burkholderiales bacterium]|nr:UbiA family prenyltransferase [Burkholderiales bacterium]
MNLSVALKLGRISNLPTVWSNVLVGALLAGGSLADARLPLLLVSLSLFYVGGMFLNDAFDREFDAKARPERPIPSGQVSAAQVFGFGYGMLALGLLLLVCVGYGFGTGTGWRPLAAGSALAAAILAYDRWHKSNPLSPLVMGLCRVLVYLTAAFAFSAVPPAAVHIGAVMLLCHLIGLTYAAKQEHLGQLESVWPLGFLAVPIIYGLVLGLQSVAALLLVVAFTAWVIYAIRLLLRRARGDVPRAVVSLIAGISLLDGILLAGHGHWEAALVAVGAFLLTLALQRWVSGT